MKYNFFLPAALSFRKWRGSFLLCLFAATSFAQPGIEWQKVLGGNYFESAFAVKQTIDTGFIVAGYTASVDGDVSGNHGSVDSWIIKLDKQGVIQWQKLLGGSDDDLAVDIQETSDGGYIVGGDSFSSDGDLSENKGYTDCWVVKLDSSGNIQWQKSYGGSGYDNATSIQQTDDGAYIFAGTTNSNDGDISSNHGNDDAWVVKISELGEIEWQRTYGGSEVDRINSIQRTADDGYILAGFTESNDGDVVGYHGNYDFWVLKLSNEGEIQWQKPLGGSDKEIAYDIQQTAEGGYIATGFTKSNDGDVSGLDSLADLWVVKLSGLGELEWQKTMGGTDDEIGRSIFQTTDGGYVLTGNTRSSDGDVSGNHGNYDCWIVRLDTVGAILWQKNLGGSSIDGAFYIEQTKDQGYILAAETWSKDGDLVSNQGQTDLWIVKLSPESVHTINLPSKLRQLQLFPNPVQQSFTLKSPHEEAILSLCITDLLGRKMAGHTISNFGQVDVSTFASGLYLVTATTEDGKNFSTTFCKMK